MFQGSAEFLFFFSLLCCAFTLPANPSALHSPCSEHAGTPGSSAMGSRTIFLSQTPTTSLSTDCNFLLVSLISSPNVLAADSDPGCSSFFFHVDPSSLWGDLCSPSCPSPPSQSFPSSAGAWQQSCELQLSPKHRAAPAQAQCWLSGGRISLWHLFVQKAAQVSSLLRVCWRSKK